MSKQHPVTIDIDLDDPLATGRNIAHQMVLPMIDKICDDMPQEDRLKLMSGFASAFAGYMAADFSAGVVEAVLLGIIKAAHTVEDEVRGQPAPGVH